MHKFTWFMTETASFTGYLLFPPSKLQSELRTTALEELKITVETYFEEVMSIFLALRLLLCAC